MERTMSQKLLAEFVGTFTLIFIGAGSIIAAGRAGAGASLVAIAIAHGFAIAVMVSALGHVSGAHFNPAVTAGVWIAQRISSSDAVKYIVAQLAGATAGAGLLRAALPRGFWEAASLGTPSPDAVSNGQAVLIEAILTFFLVWVVFATAIDPDGAFGKIAGLAIGFVITMDILMGGPFTGAAMNPARHFGPALVFNNGSFWKASAWWAYWIGPIAGGIVAAALYDGMLLRKPVAIPAAEPEAHGVGAHGEGADTTE
jgi:MIP family channel proteins